MAQRQQRYPRRAVIERMIATARSAGINVDGFEVDPDGGIRIVTGRQAQDVSAYDRWKAGRR